MKKNLMIIAACVLVVCIIACAIIAINIAKKEDDLISSVDYYYSENRNHVIIAPKGKACEDILLQELNHIDSYSSNFIRVNQILADSARTHEASDISQIVENFMCDIISGQSKTYSSAVNAGTGYPDYYAGQYIMRDKEEGIDAPYWGDGTIEQYKLCIRLVKGKEAEAQELIDYLKEYEDSIVYKYTEHSYSELCNFIFDIAEPELKSHGIQLYGWGASQSSDSVNMDVSEKDFEQVCAIASQLVEEYGMVINICISSAPEHL